MKYIELVSGIKSSLLAFGCAKVAGSVDKRESAIAIKKALECGINHFDLARCYGYGEAESFVAKTLSVPRDQIVLATKFGIEATPFSRLLRPLKVVGRRLNNKCGKPMISTGVSPTPLTTAKLSYLKQKLGNMLLQRRKITCELMLKSVEMSLRQMRTDYLDYFFVHEPHSSLEYIEELCALATALKQEGKIRVFGIATNYNYLDIHRDYITNFDIVQISNSPNADHYDDTVKRFSGTPSIFFSLFHNAENAAALKHADVLKRMALDFTSSVFVCSMMQAKHIEANVRILEQVFDGRRF